MKMIISLTSIKYIIGIDLINSNSLTLTLILHLALILYKQQRIKVFLTMKDSKLVYSTEFGRVNTKDEQPASVPQGDGIVRIRRVTKGRKGKGVSVIEGLGLKADALKTLCTELKKLCGCGGTVKEFNIEIQGDVREKLKTHLESKGMKVKLAGG